MMYARWLGALILLMIAVRYKAEAPAESTEVASMTVELPFDSGKLIASFDLRKPEVIAKLLELSSKTKEDESYITVDLPRRDQDTLHLRLDPNNPETRKELEKIAENYKEVYQEKIMLNRINYVGGSILAVFNTGNPMVVRGLQELNEQVDESKYFVEQSFRLTNGSTMAVKLNLNEKSVRDALKRLAEKYTEEETSVVPKLSAHSLHFTCGIAIVVIDTSRADVVKTLRELSVGADSGKSYIDERFVLPDGEILNVRLHMDDMKTRRTLESISEAYREILRRPDSGFYKMTFANGTMVGTFDLNKSLVVQVLLQLGRFVDLTQPYVQKVIRRTDGTEAVIKLNVDSAETVKNLIRIAEDVDIVEHDDHQNLVTLEQPFSCNIGKIVLDVNNARTVKELQQIDYDVNMELPYAVNRIRLPNGRIMPLKINTNDVKSQVILRSLAKEYQVVRNPARPRISLFINGRQVPINDAEKVDEKLPKESSRNPHYVSHTFPFVVGTAVAIFDTSKPAVVEGLQKLHSTKDPDNYLVLKNFPLPDGNVLRVKLNMYDVTTHAKLKNLAEVFEEFLAPRESVLAIKTVSSSKEVTVAIFDTGKPEVIEGLQNLNRKGGTPVEFPLGGQEVLQLNLNLDEPEIWKEFKALAEEFENFPMRSENCSSSNLVTVDLSTELVAFLVAFDVSREDVIQGLYKLNSDAQQSRPITFLIGNGTVISLKLNLYDPKTRQALKTLSKTFVESVKSKYQIVKLTFHRGVAVAVFDVGKPEVTSALRELDKNVDLEDHFVTVTLQLTDMEILKVRLNLGNDDIRNTLRKISEQYEEIPKPHEPHLVTFVMPFSNGTVKVTFDSFKRPVVEELRKISAAVDVNKPHTVKQLLLISGRIQWLRIDIENPSTRLKLKEIAEMYEEVPRQAMFVIKFIPYIDGKLVLILDTSKPEVVQELKRINETVDVSQPFELRKFPLPDNTEMTIRVNVENSKVRSVLCEIADDCDDIRNPEKPLIVSQIIKFAGGAAFYVFDTANKTTVAKLVELDKMVDLTKPYVTKEFPLPHEAVLTVRLNIDDPRIRFRLGVIASEYSEIDNPHENEWLSTPPPIEPSIPSPTELPISPPSEQPFSTTTEPPIESPSPPPIEPHIESSTEPPIEVLTEPSIESSSSSPIESSTEPIQTSTTPPIESSSESPMILHIESATDSSIESSSELLTEPPIESSSSSPLESFIEPIQTSTNSPPIESSSKSPTEPPIESPIEPTESPIEPSSEAPIEPSSEAPIEPSSESPIEPSSESPIEPSSESPIQPTKTPPIDSSREPPTESPNEPSTEWPTESPTKSPIESPIQPTKAPTTPSSNVQPIGPPLLIIIEIHFWEGLIMACFNVSSKFVVDGLTKLNNINEMFSPVEVPMSNGSLLHTNIDVNDPSVRHQLKNLSTKYEEIYQPVKPALQTYELPLATGRIVFTIDTAKQVVIKELQQLHDISGSDSPLATLKVVLIDGSILEIKLNPNDLTVRRTLYRVSVAYEEIYDVPPPNIVTYDLHFAEGRITISFNLSDVEVVRQLQMISRQVRPGVPYTTIKIRLEDGSVQTIKLDMDNSEVRKQLTVLAIDSKEVLDDSNPNLLPHITYKLPYREGYVIITLDPTDPRVLRVLTRLNAKVSHQSQNVVIRLPKPDGSILYVKIDVDDPHTRRKLRMISRAYEEVVGAPQAKLVNCDLPFNYGRIKFTLDASNLEVVKTLKNLHDKVGDGVLHELIRLRQIDGSDLVFKVDVNNPHTRVTLQTIAIKYKEVPDKSKVVIYQLPFTGGKAIVSLKVTDAVVRRLHELNDAADVSKPYMTLELRMPDGSKANIRLNMDNRATRAALEDLSSGYREVLDVTKHSNIAYTLPYSLGVISVILDVANSEVVEEVKKLSDESGTSKAVLMLPTDDGSEISVTVNPEDPATRIALEHISIEYKERRVSKENSSPKKLILYVISYALGRVEVGVDPEDAHMVDALLELGKTVDLDKPSVAIKIPTKDDSFVVVRLNMDEEVVRAELRKIVAGYRELPAEEISDGNGDAGGVEVTGWTPSFELPVEVRVEPSTESPLDGGEFKPVSTSQEGSDEVGSLENSSERYGSDEQPTVDLPLTHNGTDQEPSDQSPPVDNETDKVPPNQLLSDGSGPDQDWLMQQLRKNTPDRDPRNRFPPVDKESNQEPLDELQLAESELHQEPPVQSPPVNNGTEQEPSIQFKPVDNGSDHEMPDQLTPPENGHDEESSDQPPVAENGSGQEPWDQLQADDNGSIQKQSDQHVLAENGHDQDSSDQLQDAGNGSGQGVSDQLQAVNDGSDHETSNQVPPVGNGSGQESSEQIQAVVNGSNKEPPDHLSAVSHGLDQESSVGTETVKVYHEVRLPENLHDEGSVQLTHQTDELSQVNGAREPYSKVGLVQNEKVPGELQYRTENRSVVVSGSGKYYSLKPHTQYTYTVKTVNPDISIDEVKTYHQYPGSDDGSPIDLGFSRHNQLGSHAGEGSVVNVENKGHHWIGRQIYKTVVKKVGHTQHFLVASRANGSTDDETESEEKSSELDDEEIRESEPEEVESGDKVEHPPQYEVSRDNWRKADYDPVAPKPGENEDKLSEDK